MMKILHAVSVISIFAAVSLADMAGAVDKQSADSEILLSVKHQPMVMHQKPTWRHRQECMSHLQEQEPRLVINDDLQRKLFVMRKQP